MKQPEVQTRALLDHLKELAGGVRLDMRELPIEVVREGARATWMALAGEDYACCETEAFEIAGGGGNVPVRLYRPRQAQDRLPLVIYFHGGGWVMGDLDSYEPLVKALCQTSGAAFISVDYRLAPEYPFPAALEDAAAAVQWAHQHAAGIDCNADRLGIMGDSAGGNLAAVIAQADRNESHRRLRAQFLIYPMLDVASRHERYRSRVRNGDGRYLLANSDIDAVTSWYLDGTSAHDPRVSPLAESDLSGTPATLILSAGFDPLTSEAERYAERLTNAGVSCRHQCFDDTIHAFMSFGDLDVARRGRLWLARQVAELLA